MNSPNEIAGEAVTYGLAFHNADAWNHTAGILRATVPPESRCALAITALASCEQDEVDAIAGYLAGGAGSPIAPFDGIMSDANFWADLASRDELKAYSVACFSRLYLCDQSAFLAWAGGRVAA